MEEQLVKYFSGNLPPEEVKKIEEWRSQSDQNASEFLECHQAWKFTEEHDVNMTSALNSVMTRIKANEGEHESIPKRNFRGFMKYAAIAILGLGMAFYANFNNQEEPVQLVVEALDNLEIIALPDGSVVTLSANSKLTYHKKFKGSKRNVALVGKAFFDIRRDESKPFIVNTDQSKIEVLGTSFLVNTNAMNASTEVVVKTGRVAVSKKEKLADVVELVAGEIGQLTSNATAFKKSSIENYNYLAWKTKLIEFDNDELKTVLEVLSDVYGVKVNVSDNKIYNCQMSAKFDNQPIGSILEILGRTFGLELTKSGKKEFLLTGSGCIVAE